MVKMSEEKEQSSYDETVKEAIEEVDAMTDVESESAQQFIEEKEIRERENKLEEDIFAQKEKEEKEITPQRVEKKKEEVSEVLAEKPEDKKDEKKKKKEERVVYAHIDVDLWRTKLHREEWGIRLDAQKTTKDRQWTRDMDTIGEVKKDGETYGFLAQREGLWKSKDPLERRFVMKLFSPNFYWRCSIERLQGESFANSHATKEPCPAYVCIFKHTRNVYRIKRLAHFPRFQGEVFGFSFMDEDEIFHTFMIDDKRLTFGSDWMIKDIHHKVVAKIDGKFMNLGGKFDIDIFDEKLANDKTFFNVLILFSSTLRFLKDIKKNIKKSLKELSISDSKVKLDDSETNLYLNPRKLSV
ncbi:MAG: hypothetical protein ACTSQ2_09640 [Candidatus Heimdallarchaeaceae archaeon]